MKKIDLKTNFTNIYNHLIEKGGKPTSIAHQIGFTTTTQLQNVLSGKSQLSTQAIIGIIENLNVNPNYLFLGKGDMFLTDESEVDKLRKENMDLVAKQNNDEITILQFKEAIDKLERRNADLIDISSAAIQYHKARQGDTQTSKTDKEIDDKTAIKVLKQLGLMNENDTELNLSKIKSSITRKRK
jgi:hypothetical protein